MPRLDRSPRLAKLPTLGLLTDRLAQCLCDLADADYSTAAQLEACRQIEDLADPQPLAQAAFEAYIARFPRNPQLGDHDELTRFAGWVVLAVGPDAARQVAEGLPDTLEGGHLKAVLGLSCGLAAPDAEVGRQMARHLGKDDDAIWVAIAHLAIWRAPVSSALQALLEGTARHPLGGLLAARALEAPFEPDAHALVRRLAPAFDGGPNFAGNWPVVCALASAPDGYGSQTVFVVRRRPRGLALVGVVVSEVRGIADAIADRRLSARGFELLVVELREAHGGLFEVPIGHAMARIRQGLERAREQGMPLPLEYLLQRDLLAGLWEVDAPDPAPARRCDLALRGRTGDLFEHTALASWFLTEMDGPAAREYVREAAASAHRARSVAALEAAVEAAIDRHAQQVLMASENPAGMRTCTQADRLADRLEELAYLLDRSGSEHESSLAATAAAELRSDRPKAEQAFVRALLRTTLSESEYGWLL